MGFRYRRIVTGALCAAVVGTASHARAAGIVAGDRACVGWSHAAPFASAGRIDVDGLRGRFVARIDPRSGRQMLRWSVLGLQWSSGIDRAGGWSANPSGTAHRLDAEHALRVAATDAWLERRGWCEPNGLAGATLRRRVQHGTASIVVHAVPRAGVPVELWLDPSTGLPQRSIVRLNEDTRVVHYADWREVDGVAFPFVRRIVYPESDDVGMLQVDRVVPVAATNGAFGPPRMRDAVGMPRTARSVTVPIRFEAHKILVDVLVDGHGPFPFVFDTGGHLIVTADTARRARLHVLGRAFARVHELRIGGVVIRDDVAHVARYAYARTERGPLPAKAGWLGLELLTRFAAVIDPDRHTLMLTPLPAHATRYAGVRIALAFDEDAPLVRCRIDGVAGDCMVDTGNAGSTIVEGRWAHATGVGLRFAHGLDAGDGVHIARGSVDLGGVRLSHEVLAAYPAATRGSESTTVEAAILSETLHERYVTSIDYRQRAMWLAPAAHRAPPAFNRTGMQLRRRPDGAFDVAFVYARSPAAAAGIAPGDRVVAIDGAPSATIAPQALVAGTTAPVGTIRSYRVVDGRTHRARSVRVRLAELLP